MQMCLACVYLNIFSTCLACVYLKMLINIMFIEKDNLALNAETKILNRLMHNVPKWSDTL